MSERLNPEQLMVVQDLVGDTIAREDLPALEGAYRDFRAGMDSLKAAFEQQTRSGEKAGAAEQEVQG
ncbi:hypothetical protein AB4089_17345 [Arthrobacter sp. 2MCAF15]|uniref:hypothetical protein n=1 Tax=Arthrobacter sp. 2MCAF15 TaxID=3232984 RepID=UPI003F8FA9D0